MNVRTCTRTFKIVCKQTLFTRFSRQNLFDLLLPFNEQFMFKGLFSSFAVHFEIHIVAHQLKMTKVKKRKCRPLNRFELKKFASSGSSAKKRQPLAPINSSNTENCDPNHLPGPSNRSNLNSSNLQHPVDDSFDDRQSTKSDSSFSYQQSSNSSSDYYEPVTSNKDTVTIEEIEDGYQLINMRLLVKAISGLMKCPNCCGDLKLCRHKFARIGLHEELCFACPNCMQFRRDFANSTKTADPTLVSKHIVEDVNVRSVRLIYLKSLKLFEFDF